MIFEIGEGDYLNTLCVYSGIYFPTHEDKMKIIKSFMAKLTKYFYHGVSREPDFFVNIHLSVTGTLHFQNSMVGLVSRCTKIALHIAEYYGRHG